MGSNCDDYISGSSEDCDKGLMCNVHAWIRLHSVGEMKYEQVGLH